MEIRKGNRNDLEKIILLLKQVSMLHIKMRPDIFKTKTKENIKAEAIEVINDKERIVIVAEENKIILGIMVLKIKQVSNHINLKDAKILWVEELCVDEKNRRNGIGRKLINKAIEVAKENNCKRLELNCWEENYKAISFYEKQGMQTQRRIMEINI